MTVHGLLLVNKPAGWTSHDLVAKIRRIVGQKSVGHCGTLDPLAEGLMVVLLGEATKLSQYILDGDKGYVVTAILGKDYDTLDVTGAVVNERPLTKNAEEIAKEISALQGSFVLDIPLYSAAKVDGKALHRYARDGEAEQVVIPKKEMNFYDVQLLEQGYATDSEGQQVYQIKAKMGCSKGSFIRSWVSLLGERLGCGAAMSGLTRTRSVPYSLDQALSLQEIEKKVEMKELDSVLIPLGLCLPEVKYIRVKGQDQVFILNGQISHSLKSLLISIFKPEVDQIIKILSQDRGELLALVGLEPGRGFVVRRVFRY